MLFYHQKSVTIGDATSNTNIVRPSDWNSYHVGALTIGGNTNNASTWSGSNLQLDGGNNVTLKITGNTLEISGPSQVYASIEHYIPFMGSQAMAGILNASYFVIPVNLPAAMDIGRVVHMMQVSFGSNTSGTLTVSMWAQLFTLNGATLSNLASGSTAHALTYQGTNANSTTASGQRMVHIPLQHNATPGHYWLGMLLRSTSGGANATVSQIIITALNSAFSGSWGQATNASNQMFYGYGTFGTTQSTTRETIAIADLRQGGAALLRSQPYFILSNSRALP